MVFAERSHVDQSDLSRGSLPTAVKAPEVSTTKEAGTAAHEVSASTKPLKGMIRLQESENILSGLTSPDRAHLQEPAELSPEAIKDLTALKRVFKVRVLRGPGEDGKQLVVLQGDQHSFNSDKTIRQFKDVIKHFKRFGHEGKEADKYLLGETYFKDREELWAGDCKKRALNNTGSMDIAQDVIDDFYRTEIAKHSRPLEEAIYSDLFTPKDGIWSQDEGRLAALTPQQYGVSQAEFDGAVARVREELANPAPPRIEGPPNHHLEAGHKPDVIEHFNSLHNAMIARAMKLFIERPLVGIAVGIAAGIGYVFAFTQLPLVGTAAVWGYIAATKYSNSHSRARRDQTMAANIDEICTSYPSEEPMLAQMGNAHIDGVAKNLIQRGWREEHPFG